MRQAPLSRRRRLISGGIRWLLAATFFLSISVFTRAQDASFSGSLADPLATTLAPDSQQSGLSSSLLPEGTNLLTPSVRIGISDPLGFLIETGSMSPYPDGLGFSNSYADAQPQTQGLNDPILALRFGEYRNNRVLMAGAATVSTPGARTAGAGMTAAGLARQRMVGAGTTSAETVVAPFAAGSSALAARGGAQSSFLDPNALVLAASGALSGASGSPSAGDADPSAASESSLATAVLGSAAPAGFSSSDTDLANNSGVIPMGYVVGSPAGSGLGATAGTQAPGLILDNGADAMPIGVAPGRVQPQFTLSMASTTGFPDSTLGTAGSSMPELPTGASPLLWSTANADSAASPDLGGQSISFLHPSLRPSATLLPQRRTTVPSLEEAARKARLQALLKNPNAVLPSAFAQRTMMRDYQKQQQGGRQGRRPSHYGSGIGTTLEQQERH